MLYLCSDQKAFFMSLKSSWMDEIQTTGSSPAQSATHLQSGATLTCMLQCDQLPHTPSAFYSHCIYSCSQPSSDLNDLSFSFPLLLLYFSSSFIIRFAPPSNFLGLLSFLPYLSIYSFLSPPSFCTDCGDIYRFSFVEGNSTDFTGAFQQMPFYCLAWMY